MSFTQARIYEYFLEKNDVEILLVENDKECERALSASEFAGLKSFILPDLRVSFGDDLRSFNAELLELCKSLNEYFKFNGKKLLISPYRTLLNPLPSKRNLKTITLSFAQKIGFGELKDELVRLGYEPVGMVESEGEFSIRGDIVDIFALNLQKPVRVLFFDDEIESIRHYDASTQLSLKEELESVEIVPFLANQSKSEFDLSSQKIASLKSDALISDMASLGFWAIDGFEDYLATYRCAFAYEIELDEESADKFNGVGTLPEAAKFRDFAGSITPEFFEFHQGKEIRVLSQNESQLLAFGVPKSPNITSIITPLCLNLTSSDEIIVSLNKPKKRKRPSRKATIVIDELNTGDYVVHESYGIGRFLGLESVSVLGARREFVALSYLGGDKLLLPVENLNLIDRYIASGGGVPSLDKLGKASFVKLKERVKEKLFIIASKIIAMAAKRELIQGELIALSEQERADFIARAGFIYTVDQEKATNDILSELGSGKAMDRLLSGDVGFGKTEVAMNAIFACLRSGFQALFFVPTTLLSAQHYASLKSRLGEYGLKIYRLDRFSSTKEKSAVKSALASKEPCVVVGTHSLLSLGASNLGLIVIDEEHKFGVKQKERLKELGARAHLLSMSATPIPRSLSMALSHLKTYSTLLTPPEDRLDVRTFVREYEGALIKEAINRELRRKGQVFYIHNHIASMPAAKSELTRLIPHLRILSLHSKIDAKTTEDEMMKFMAGEYDLLLCTSIVESGIHLPNANTIIVENANKFGIADLHQLRGRVGRSDKQAYCYFLVGDENISDEAKKRLVALESNSFLGAGSLLARHDLEIRGGGNLIGEAQSGHIEAIGYSLYLKMLEDEINKLLNQSKEQINDIDMRLAVSAFINPELVGDDRQRLELYRRLSKAKNTAEVYAISGEIEDRFGKLDRYTKQFIELMVIKILAIDAGVSSISSSEQNVFIKFISKEPARLKSRSRDDDDVLACVSEYLRGLSV
ncbi:DEAD/DEAH box helicase [Campylobacter sp. 19-13652]|uniref:DEAD/DEAH box helicase n=1 Tax=Campylobacter sp. 19-13652 TaxID=2840180 RepID=UPI001C74E0F3|nr:DEAD/DEAH box helicase [Campylobacter sp. 19-13652]BCX79392.1 transcription-repair-coupling factor [Campylobacter sp. 19-13652]